MDFNRRVGKSFKREYKMLNAIQLRDKAWKDSTLIPSWVRGRNIGLDQYNTLPEVAQYCWKSFKAFMKKEQKQLNDFIIIEPSAGAGSFYNLLPKENRIGIDIEVSRPFENEYIRADFLTWNPDKQANYLTIGNPPFGYRSWLALSFLNHAAEFSEYIGFILPMAFQSNGKGSPRFRVKNMELVHQEFLTDQLFLSNTGAKTNVNTLWQIWKKGTPLQAPDLSACDDWVEIFTVDQRKERLCGVEKMKTCNLFLQRTFYNKPPTLVTDFSQVKYSCGYGIILKKETRKTLWVLKDADWSKYSNLATHNCRHISMYHIKQVLFDNLIK
jgi:hypothetical protein